MGKRICEQCREGEGVYAMQYISSNVPSFYTLGSHIRGLKVTLVCKRCASGIKAELAYAQEEVEKFLNLVKVEER